MTQAASRIWDEIAPSIPNLSPGHARILSDFCHCIAELEFQRGQLAEEGLVVKGRRDALVKNPRMQAVRELRTAVQRYSSDFGLNPTAAFRLAGHGQREESPGEELLDGVWQPDDRLN